MLAVKRNYKFIYSIFGISFGLLFPIFSTCLEIYLHKLEFSIHSFFFIQKEMPLLWVIDTAPFFLGIFAFFIGYNQDILVKIQKKTISEYMNLESKFSAIFQDGEFGILIFHLGSGKFENMNPFFYNLVGYSKEELEKLGFEKITHPEDIAEERKIFKKIIKSKESASFKKRFIHKDGHFIWTKLTYSVIKDQYEKPRFIFTLVDDVTKEKLTSEELISQQKFIREVINLSPDLIFVKDELGKLILVNEAFAKSYGKQISEIENKLNSEIHSETDELEHFDKIDKLVLEKNKIISGEEEFTDTNGNKIHYLTTKIPIKDSKQNKFVLGFAQDITKVKKTEANLIRAKESAEQASKLKSEFLANMSHEIRTPLNGILGMTRILSETNLNEEQKDLVETIKISGDSLLVILNDILDYSKVEAGKIDLEKISFDIEKSTKEIQSLFQHSAIQKNLEFRINFDERIKKNILGDQFRLRQVLLNLIGNAIKFTQNGYVELKISLGSESNDQYKLIFEVTDSGIGIPKEKLMNLFQSFTQVDSSISRKFGGTGLGLAISSKLILLMNSELKVDSEFGKGTKFYFEIFFDTIEKDILSDEIKNKKSIPKNLKILLAEDNLINQKLALKIFKKMGYEISVANNGEEAIQILDKENFDLIFMDMQMPILDGLQASKKIRSSSDYKDIKIIALTANAMSTDRELCFEAGMNGFITKPFKQEDIEIAISDLYQST